MLFSQNNSAIAAIFSQFSGSGSFIFGDWRVAT